MKRSVFAGIVLLLGATVANALVVSTPDVIVSWPRSDILVPINVAGGDLVKSATLNVGVEGGTIIGIDWTAGIFGHSQNVIDPPVVYTDSAGRSAAFSEYSLAFTQASVPASGIVAVLHLNFDGLPDGSYGMLLDGLDGGDTSMNTEWGIELAGALVPGHIILVPEPAGVALLAVGALFLRRRV